MNLTQQDEWLQAAKDGYVPIVRALLERGADAHAVDAEDKTPLARAAARNHAEVIDLLNLSARDQLPTSLVSACCRYERQLLSRWQGGRFFTTEAQSSRRAIC